MRSTSGLRMDWLRAYCAHQHQFAVEWEGRKGGGNKTKREGVDWEVNEVEVEGRTNHCEILRTQLYLMFNSLTADASHV